MMVQTKISIVLIGVVLFFLLTGEKGYCGKSEDQLRLFILGSNKIHIVDVNTKTGNAELFNEFEEKSIRSFEVLGNEFIAESHSLLQKFNADFNLVKTLNFRRIDALTVHGGTVYVSAESQLKIFSKDLQEIGSVKLNFKNAEDIIIIDQTAYLLDNKLYPLFVFRVDISNPTKPVITGKLEITGINAHLPRQWVDVEKDLWFVEQSYSHRGGSGSNVHVFPLRKGMEKITQFNLYDVNRIGASYQDMKQVSQGRQLWWINKFKPFYSVFNEKENFVLYDFQYDQKKIEWKKIMDLPFPAYKPIRKKGKDNRWTTISFGSNQPELFGKKISDYLFLVNGRGYMLIYKVGDPLTLVAEMNLMEKFGFYSVKDIVKF